MLLPAQKLPNRERRGMVLLSVLVVIIILTLAAYQYSEYMMAEYQAANSTMNVSQAKALAMSGVNYVAVSLSNTSYFTNTLNNNPYDNPQYFQDIQVSDDPNNPRRQGHFTIISLLNPDDPLAASTPYRYGVYDEAGKINLNALLQYDKTGTVGYNILMGFQNLGMTDAIANCILDWLDPTTTTPRTSGAKDEYYMALPVPYHCKNGPMDSIEEMLLVEGVTAQLLFGNDRNRNGILDSDEDPTIGSTPGQVDLGWSAFFTVYSREPNASNAGNPRIYLNDTISNLVTNLATTTPALTQDMINYILAARMFGVTPLPPGSMTTFQALTGQNASDFATLLQTQISAASSSSGTGSGGGGLKSIASVYSLINSTVSITVPSTTMGQRMFTMTSPLTDKSQLTTLLPVLLDQCSTSQAADLTPRINITNCSQTVLSTLPGFSPTDIANIMTNRPTITSGAQIDAIYSTPAWLITEASVSPTTMQTVERFITGRSSVFSFQAIGYFSGGGAMVRLQAVVDTNFSRPRVVYLRDISELGRGGFELSTGGDANAVNGGAGNNQQGNNQ